MTNRDPAVSRRIFLRSAALAGAYAAWPSEFGAAARRSIPWCGDTGRPWSVDDYFADASGRRPAPPLQELPWNPIRRMAESRPTGLTLTAAPGTADLGGGVEAQLLLLNGGLPSPLLRVHRGERFQVKMVNQIRDALVLHWHGLTPPEESDGHPRFAVGPGASIDYSFTVEDRASTYFYHPHTHFLTARQVFAGMAGMLIVEDEEEAALGLPSGEREIPLILQDRRVDEFGRPTYPDVNVMEGYMGPEAFGNGIHRPYLELDTALYRFRILNGSNARIFRLERSDGRPWIIIGNDGGLLERPVRVPHVEMGPGERIDALVDLRDAEVGHRFVIRSMPFEMPAAYDLMGGGDLQGAEMDLVQVRVTRKVTDRSRIPEELSVVRGPDPADSVRERRFELNSDRDPMSRSIHMRHQINKTSFEMDRIDLRVPFGQTEIWTFANENQFAHPMHLHATHFRVLSRENGRGEVMPWEGGLKDTVLVHPGETVKVAVRFTSHRGLYLLHCHNLEHEDMGMMLNVQVE